MNEDESKQLCSIEADNQTSLPAADQTATAGFIIVRGSSALVLDTGDRYIMNSGGTWIQQPSGVQLDLSGYATQQDLTDGLAGKVDTSTYNAGQAAQDTVIATKITMENILGTGRQITDTAGQDALTLGKFYCANATDAGNITTSPWNSAYFGFTMRSVSTSQRFVQIAIQNDDNFHMAKRRYTGSWQPWAYISNI